MFVVALVLLGVAVALVAWLALIAAWVLDA